MMQQLFLLYIQQHKTLEIGEISLQFFREQEQNTPLKASLFLENEQLRKRQSSKGHI